MLCIAKVAIVSISQLREMQQLMSLTKNEIIESIAHIECGLVLDHVHVQKRPCDFCVARITEVIDSTPGITPVVVETHAKAVFNVPAPNATELRHSLSTLVQVVPLIGAAHIESLP